MTVASFTRSVVNLVAGIKERVLYTDSEGTLPPPCTSPLKPLHDLAAMVAQMVGTCNPISAASYVASKKGSKRKTYERALANLRLKVHSLGELASLKFFVKREATVWSKQQVPRVISPRTPEFNILLGRYLHPVEETIFAALGTLFPGDRPAIAKGLTQQAKAATIKHYMDIYGCCVGLDASRFDQCISRELLEVEHGLYRKLFPNSRLLDQLLKQQMVVKGTGLCNDGFVKYRGRAMRCSGDVNTSLGNCVISVLLAKAYCDSIGITSNVFCDGDDLLLFVSPSSLSLLADLPAFYLGYGVRMKVEPPAFELEQVEFCQAKCVWDGAGWVLCRNPFKALNTDAFVPYALRQEHSLVLNRSVGLCGLTMAAGMPMLQTYYSKLIETGETGKFESAGIATGMHMQHAIQVRAGHLPVVRPVDPECRVSFWKAFGISIDDQLLFEKAIEEWDPRRQFKGVICPKLHCEPIHCSLRTGFEHCFVEDG